MATTTEEDLIHAVENWIRHPGGFGDGFKSAVDVGEVGTEAAADAAVAAEGSGVAVVADAAGEFFLDLGGWIIVVAIAALIVNGKIFEQLLLRLVPSNFWV